MTAAIVATGITLLGLAVMLVAEWKGHRPARATAKPIASAGFIGVALACGATATPWGIALLVALILSWWGDVLLLWRNHAGFLAGLVAFLLGHVGFVVAFVLRGVDLKVVAIAAVIVLLVAIGVGRWLLPRAPVRLRWPIVAYMTVISAMVATAFGTAVAVPAFAIAGASVAFFISDICVAIDRFIAPGFAVRAVLLPLYYGAQLVFAWSVA